MSYDQHTSLTTPGPIASAAWVEKIILHLLEAIPPTKISLGIPTYSGYWTTNVLGASLVPERYSFRSKEAQIGYPKLTSLLAQFDQKLIWNKQWQSSYAIYDNHGHNEYIFAENAQSFKAKLALAKKYHLRGISVWKLGLEDPAIWNVLNPALTQHHGE
jgi:spore germination protein